MSSQFKEERGSDPKKYQSTTIGDATPATGKKLAMKYRSLTRKGTKTARPTLNVVDDEKHDNDSEEERAPNLVI